MLNVSRSNQYANKLPRKTHYRRKDDGELLSSVLAVTKDRGIYGYPRVTALINRERRKRSAVAWNKKRVLRVMRRSSIEKVRSNL